jgi:hypothetical protein
MCSARVFVSHASNDKRPAVRAIVEGLLHCGIPVWVDRPGAGDGNLGLTDEEIRRHDVQGLASGRPWNVEIMEAHRGAGAVLACFSHSLTREREVLVQELAFAAYADKLVACILDDMPFSAIPAALGLVDASRIQAHRIDTARLSSVVRLLRSGASTDALDPPQREQWEIFLALVRDILAVFRRSGIGLVTHADRAQALARLEAIPHAPMVRAYEIPGAVIQALADRVASPAAARLRFQVAMELAWEGRNAGDTRPQVVVSASEVIPPEQNALLDYWMHVFAVAGSKSRRTTAALLLAPVGDGFCDLPADVGAAVARFLRWLQEPRTGTGTVLEE